jgi:2-phosphosulfolactate phosphatase
MRRVTDASPAAFFCAWPTMPDLTVDVALLPRDLPPVAASRVTVVVFDVLRATTSIAAALAAGVKEIHVFGGTALAAEAARAAGRDGVLLCGEERCLPPAGFDLGNSPGAFDPSRHAGRTAYLSTTNGTRAILAARGAARILTAALVNASAAARAAREAGDDVVLLCSGTNGHVAAEDVIGAGAVLHALRSTVPVRLATDTAWLAEELFLRHRHDLRAALRQSLGGRNVVAAGLEDDIDFAARLDSLTAVGEVRPGDPPVICAAQQR